MTVDEKRPGIFLDIRPLRESPAYARLWFGSTISGIGAQLTIVAVGLHIYEITQSTLAVALVGVVALLPMIIAGLYGGMLADAFDRRTVLIGASILAWVATIGIATVAWLNVETLWPYYLLTVVNAVAATVVGTARGSVTARLVRRELLPAASALGGISMGLFITVGPLLSAAGLLFLSRITADGSYAGQILPGQIMFGVGVAFVFVPLQNLALAGIQPRDSGVAGAALTATQQIGGSIGIAVFTALYTTAVSGFGESAMNPFGGLVAGYSTVFIAAAIVMIVAAPIGFFLVNVSRAQFASGEKAVHLG